MIKRFCIFFVILLSSVFVSAQIPAGFTQVTATVPALSGGSFNASWKNLSGQSALPLLGGVSSFQAVIVGNFDSNGYMSTLLADPAQIFPTPSTWVFSLSYVCPGSPNGGYTVSISTPITGGGGTTQDVSSQLISNFPITACGGAPTGAFVTLATSQTITGKKTFTQTMTFPANYQYAQAININGASAATEFAAVQGSTTRGPGDGLSVAMIVNSGSPLTQNNAIAAYLQDSGGDTYPVALYAQTRCLNNGAQECFAANFVTADYSGITSIFDEIGLEINQNLFGSPQNIWGIQITGNTNPGSTIPPSATAIYIGTGPYNYGLVSTYPVGIGSGPTPPTGNLLTVGCYTISGGACFGSTIGMEAGTGTATTISFGIGSGTQANVGYGPTGFGGIHPLGLFLSSPATYVTGFGGNTLLSVLANTGDVVIGSSNDCGSSLCISSGATTTQISMMSGVSGADEIFFGLNGTNNAVIGYGPTGFGGTHPTGAFISSDSTYFTGFAGIVSMSITSIAVENFIWSIDSFATAAPLGSGTTQNGFLRLVDNAGSGRTLDIGIDNPNGSWLQSRDSATSYATTYTLELNPIGGIVKIGPGGLSANGTAGVSCSGLPTASFASILGITTHC